LGYAAGRKTTIDVTDLIWQRASMKSFSLFAQPAEVWITASSVIFQLLQSGVRVGLWRRIYQQNFDQIGA